MCQPFGLIKSSSHDLTMPDQSASRIDIAHRYILKACVPRLRKTSPQEESLWLPQRLVADLFQVSVKTANEHLVNIYDEGELAPSATIRKFRIVQTEGNREVSRIVDAVPLAMLIMAFGQGDFNCG
jgi:hypothetical protein